MNTHFISPVALMRWLRHTVLVTMLIALSACSTAQIIGNVEHGFDVKNKGTTNISGVQIEYGGKPIKFCRPYCLPTAGSHFGVYMPIQDHIQVSWQTADGQQHQATVPVKSRLKDARRLSTLYLQFTGDRLVVTQGLQYDNPTLVGLEIFPLFP